MTHPRIHSLLDRLSSHTTQLYQGDFLCTWDHPLPALWAVLLAAEVLEEMWRANLSARVFQGGLAVSIFRDQSTRTRFSYAGAAALLGLALQELDEGKSQIAHGETLRETANMISFLTEAIGIRDDLFLGEGHKYMAEVAAALAEGHREGVLPQRPAVINLQSDLDHPTQALADLLHLQTTFGSLEALRGRRIAVTWAHAPSYGKPLSVPQGVIGLMTRFGMQVVLAHPEGYNLMPEIVDHAARQAAESGGSFQCVQDMAEAFRDADVVYPKSWAPLRVMQERTRLLRNGRTAELGALAKECLASNARYRNWECTQPLMSLTRYGQALYMHCLPADISGVSCPAGEVAASVFDHCRLTTYRQAAHKPFIIAALILMTRFEQPAALLRQLVERGTPRRIG